MVDQRMVGMVVGGNGDGGGARDWREAIRLRSLVARAEVANIRITERALELLEKSELATSEIVELVGCTRQAVADAANRNMIEGAYRKLVGKQELWHAPTESVIAWREGVEMKMGRWGGCLRSNTVRLVEQKLADL